MSVVNSDTNTKSIVLWELGAFHVILPLNNVIFDRSRIRMCYRSLRNCHAAAGRVEELYIDEYKVGESSYAQCRLFHLLDESTLTITFNEPISVAEYSTSQLLRSVWSLIQKQTFVSLPVYTTNKSRFNVNSASLPRWGCTKAPVLLRCCIPVFSGLLAKVSSYSPCRPSRLGGFM